MVCQLEFRADARLKPARDGVVIVIVRRIGKLCEAQTTGQRAEQKQDVSFKLCASVYVLVCGWSSDFLA